MIGSGSMVAFVELRARLRETPAARFVGGEAARDNALEQTERDYVALVAAGAEAAQLEVSLGSADREATQARGRYGRSCHQTDARARRRGRCTAARLTVLRHPIASGSTATTATPGFRLDDGRAKTMSPK
jgi:hypothetical protein